MTDIDKLIRMNIEIEGILLVIRNRDSIEARNLLSDKIEEYTSALNSFLFAKSCNEPEKEDVEPVTVEVQPEVTVVQPELTEVHPEVAVVQPEMTEVHPEVAVVDEMVAETAETQVVDNSVDKTTSLLKAFTLNDRFRFRRELFAGDDGDFHETLKLIADMDSYSEACDYLYNDMMWDRSDPVVSEFMAILAANMPQ